MNIKKFLNRFCSSSFLILISMLATCNVVLAQHSVTLTVGVSSDTGVTKYSFYRSLTTGGPYNLTTPVCVASAPPTGTTTVSCTDSNVTNGTTYYYVATAFDAANTGKSPSTNVAGESAFSNEASAAIPATITPAPGVTSGTVGLTATVH